MDYTIIWRTNIMDVDSPEEAVKQAHRDSAFGTSTIYEVFEGIVQLDLPTNGVTLDVDGL